MGKMNKKLFKTGKRIVRLLKKNKKTLAAAESCTGGLIAATVVSVDGASGVFWGSFVTYMPDAKHHMVDVKYKTMKKCGLISKKTAKEMAAGALKVSGADYAVAVTGLAGDSKNLKKKNPVNETEPKDPDYGKPIGLVFVAVASEKKVVVKKFMFKGNRNTIRQKATIKALKLLEKNMGHGDGEDAWEESV